MKLLAYGDMHATDGDELCFTQPNSTLQHYRVAKFFDDIARIAQVHNCTDIVDLGDTTSDRSSIHWTTVEVIGTGLSKLKDLKLWKITGNHEQYLRDTSINNRRLFDQRFCVIDTRKIWKMNGGWTAFFVSYPADYSELTEWLVKHGREMRGGPKILFGHFQVKGAFYQGGKATAGVPLEALEPFSMCLLGHIHLPQSLSHSVHYVGSPFQQDWGEIGQPKRVAILDTDTMVLDWVPMEGYPEYREVTLDEFDSMKGVNTEDRYRVVLNSHEEAELFFRHANFARATAKYNYDEAPAQEAVETKDWSPEGIIRRYMKTVPPNKVGISLSDDEMLEMSQQIVT
jgi:hypothetical protein